MSIQALREQRAALGKQLHTLVNSDDWKPERDQPIYDAGMSEIEAIDARIARIEAVNARTAEETRTGEVAEAAARAGRDAGNRGAAIFAKWLRGGDKALDEDDWRQVRNAQSTTVGSQGGFTVDSSVAASVLSALKEFGGMRSVASIISTATGGPMSFPTSNGTAELGELVAENATATDLDVSFGTIALPVFKFSSKVVAIPFELLQDSSVDVEAFARARLVERLGRIMNRMYTIGTGAGQPHGVQVAASVGVTAANGTTQVTAVTYESLVDLQHSVDPAYRALGRTRWMFNDSTLKTLRKIKDASQRPIFVPGYETGSPMGAPDMLLGRPITINQDMPDMAASVDSILFGDFSFYTIRDVMALELFRFTDSAYTKLGQVGFLAWLRSGGNLIDVGGAVKKFRNAAS